jgi:hypothetical protein
MKALWLKQMERENIVPIIESPVEESRKSTNNSETEDVLSTQHTVNFMIQHQNY